jgi:hypothetical protein
MKDEDDEGQDEAEQQPVANVIKLFTAESYAFS